MGIGITIGDPSGIGPEIVIKALAALPHPSRHVVYGSLDVLASTLSWMHELGVAPASPPRFTPLDAASPGEVGVVDVLPGAPLGDLIPGVGDPRGARLQLAALQRAIADAKAGAIDGIVTAPWTKALFGTIDHPPVGHTEVLAEAFDAPEHVMMLAGPRLRVALVTTHLPVREVSAALSATRLRDVIRTTIGDLRRLFDIERPRLAVCGLNPHAGEAGTMGREELDLIGPTIEALRAEFEGRASIAGPAPSDTLFARFGRGEQPYDAIIAMYHDQGLIPLKLLHFGESANITLGLPVVRTSVDHGTAYDIAGKGVADAGSMGYAIDVGLQLAGNLQRSRERG